MNTTLEDVINDENSPDCLKYFLLVNRLRATDRSVIVAVNGEPKCFATWEGSRVRLVMASRFDDVGITEDLESSSGYSHRVYVDDLTDFSSKP